MTQPQRTPRTAAVIGLGSMGAGMAASLARAGFAVLGVDVAAANRERFAAQGGRVAASAAEAARGADVVVCVVVNAAQTADVLFGSGASAEAMPEGAVFLGCATADPANVRPLAARLEAMGRLYLDAPISGGAARAAKGELTIMASGSPAAFERAGPALDAMAARTYRLGDEAGTRAALKMIQHALAGVHLPAPLEGVALAAKQGLDLTKVYEVITASAGNSWMFENRMPHVLAGDYAPLSSIEIFVKDLGIVQDMARAERYPAPVAAAALQMYLAASGAGMGLDDDSSLARLYARLSGAKLPEKKG